MRQEEAGVYARSVKSTHTHKSAFVEDVTPWEAQKLPTGPPPLPIRAGDDRLCGRVCRRYHSSRATGSRPAAASGARGGGHALGGGGGAARAGRAYETPIAHAQLLAAS